MKSKLRLGIATVVLLLIVWEVVAHLFFKPYTLPPPSDVAASLWQITLDGTLWEELRYSLMRVFVGYVVAAALAIPLGILTGWFAFANNTVGSVMELLRPIPSLALVPLAIVWLGFGETSKIVIIAYAAFFSIYLNTQAGVRNIDPLLIRVMQVYGKGTWDTLRRVVVYAILPFVFVGLRYSAAVALILLVAVELVGSQNGLGFYLIQQQGFLQVSNMFAAIVVFGILGFASNLVLLWLERVVVRWRERVGSQ